MERVYFLVLSDVHYYWAETTEYLLFQRLLRPRRSILEFRVTDSLTLERALEGTTGTGE